MSRATKQHYQSTTSCPKCGARVQETQYGAITEYTCVKARTGQCDWSLDWPTPGSRPGVMRAGAYEQMCDDDNYD